MTYSKLRAFDRPLQGAAVPGNGGRFYSEKELAARDEAAYRRGVDATRALADQQLVDLRAELEELGNGVFEKLVRCEPTLLAELREALPSLGLEIARRLLAGYEPPPEVVSRLCEEALVELFPERENLEVAVSPRDATVLETLGPDWLRRYPGLRIRADASLVPGDCQVRSRFGLTDARLQTKLTALEHGLLSV
jgi:flagellar assembly protein FliH